MAHRFWTLLVNIIINDFTIRWILNRSRSIVNSLCVGDISLSSSLTLSWQEVNTLITLNTINILNFFGAWDIHKKYSGDKSCLFQPCQEKDFLHHVIECKCYDTKFFEGDGPIKDWATYLVNLSIERMKKFD